MAEGNEVVNPEAGNEVVDWVARFDSAGRGYGDDSIRSILAAQIVEAERQRRPEHAMPEPPDFLFTSKPWVPANNINGLAVLPHCSVRKRIRRWERPEQGFPETSSGIGCSFNVLGFLGALTKGAWIRRCKLLDRSHERSELAVHMTGSLPFDVLLRWLNAAHGVPYVYENRIIPVSSPDQLLAFHQFIAEQLPINSCTPVMAIRKDPTEGDHYSVMAKDEDGVVFTYNPMAQWTYEPVETISKSYWLQFNSFHSGFAIVWARKRSGVGAGEGGAGEYVPKRPRMLSAGGSAGGSGRAPPPPIFSHPPVSPDPARQQRTLRVISEMNRLGIQRSSLTAELAQAMRSNVNLRPYPEQRWEQLLSEAEEIMEGPRA